MQNFRNYNMVNGMMAGMAIDADIFNIMFITPLEGKMLYGSFNCILGMQDEWEKIAMYCIRTIKKVEEE